MEGNSTVVTDPLAFETAAHCEIQTAGNENMWSTNFNFDFSYCDRSDAKCNTQDMIARDVGGYLLEASLAGFNCSVFVYGQTGSGKTYTMMGAGGFGDDVASMGLVPRLCRSLFLEVAKQEAVLERTSSSHISVSYFEIYNEVVFDLFGCDRPKQVGGRVGLRVRENPVSGAYVAGLAEITVSSYTEIMHLLVEGSHARTVAATNMNRASSRSHAVFVLYFCQTEIDVAACAAVDKRSKISMVDLAGSERMQKTGVMQKSERLKEAVHINKSLSALGDVINTLAQRPNAGSTDAGGHVPFRNSTLTWLLKESLGGNSKTVMLGVISPCHRHYQETLSTLRY
jgi:hypothetical protein